MEASYPLLGWRNGTLPRGRHRVVGVHHSTLHLSHDAAEPHVRGGGVHGVRPGSPVSPPPLTRVAVKASISWSSSIVAPWQPLRSTQCCAVEAPMWVQAPTNSKFSATLPILPYHFLMMTDLERLEAPGGARWCLVMAGGPVPSKSVLGYQSRPKLGLKPLAGKHVQIGRQIDRQMNV